MMEAIDDGVDHEWSAATAAFAAEFLPSAADSKLLPNVTSPDTPRHTFLLTFPRNLAHLTAHFIVYPVPH